MYQLYIPESLRTQLLRSSHQDPLAGHIRRYKTYRRMKSLVHWPKLSWDAKQFVTDCQVCQLHKPESHKPAGKLQQTVIHHPWEILGMDLMDPFPRSSKRNLYLLVFVDYYTRRVELFPLRKATADSISHILTQEMFT